MSSSSDGKEDGPPRSTRPHVPSSKQRPNLSPFERSSSPEALIQENGMSSNQATVHQRNGDEPEAEGSAKKRHRVSRSSGFLLRVGSSSKSPKQSDHRHTTPNRQNVSPSSSKGKSKAIGRSPLGVEVVSSTDGVNEKLTGSPRPNGSLITEGFRLRKHAPTTETNQAQIVNLALNLSESRRRHFSSNRISSADIMERRVPSRNLISPSPTTLYSQSPKSTQPVSPAIRYSAESAGLRSTSNSGRASTWSAGNSSLDVDSPRSPFGLPMVEAEDFYPSEATLLRVQKAKDTIELSYEYRRLLQHLPSLPKVRPERLQSGWKGSKAESQTTKLGREYNPLQYVRNRKVRRRENKPLDAEGQGWKRVGAVRQWVDDVGDEREKDVSIAHDRYPLPVFPTDSDTLDLRVQSPDTILNGLDVASPPMKETRPRVDWMVDPWNLLADAYWLAQDHHMQLIEDSKGRKIFPILRTATSDIRRNSVTHRRSMSLPRPISKRNSVILEESVHRDSLNMDRGRKLHLRQQSVGSTRDYSGSRDRKGTWRRLVGSRSPSSTEDSGSGKRRRDAHKRAYMTAKEKEDSLILEKQIMDLMAKEPHNIEYARSNGASSGHLDEQSFPGMSSRPSSPEGDIQSRPLSVKNSQDLSAHLGLVERTREMQPRRFSVSHGIDDIVDSPASPVIEINVSPPRSRSRSAPLAKDRPKQIITVSVDNGDDGLRLSPKTARTPRRSFDSTREIRPQVSKDFESRLRGLLKGTKIADIVGNPVSKMGDLIWKRDQNDQELLNSPAESIYEPSDMESSVIRKNTTDDSGVQSITDGRYQTAGLPVFTSPFRGRQRGRSFETGRRSTELADTVKKEDEESNPVNKIDAIATASSQDLQRSTASSRDRPSADFRNMERRDAVTDFGKPADSASSANMKRISLWPDMDGLQYINVTKRLLSPIHQAISKKDIVILKALTQCTLTTASTINNQIRDTQTNSTIDSQSLSIHALAYQKAQTAQSTLGQISTQNTMLRDELTNLSNTTVPNLYETLTTLEDRITNSITPTVRTAGDSADKLSAELATTRTLEVKRLNDELDLISRRRRRKLRWLRRGLYWGLEWTLLGLMWWAWLLVVCFRLVRGTIRGVYTVVGWLIAVD